MKFDTIRKVMLAGVALYTTYHVGKLVQFVEDIKFVLDTVEEVNPNIKKTFAKGFANDIIDATFEERKDDN